VPIIVVIIMVLMVLLLVLLAMPIVVGQASIDGAMLVPQQRRLMPAMVLMSLLLIRGALISHQYEAHPVRTMFPIGYYLGLEWHSDRKCT
jgi:hypothetical protein